MSQHVRVLTRPIVRELALAHGRVYVRLTPEGNVECRQPYERAWHSMPLAQLFPHTWLTATPRRRAEPFTRKRAPRANGSAHRPGGTP